jgi:TPP-dependent indolepyruvate ferredoxin oxidoreductase alpha subunit
VRKFVLRTRLLWSLKRRLVLRRIEAITLTEKRLDKLETTQIIDGNRAGALGAKLSRVQVIAAYPITPQTPVTEALSEFVVRGELDAQYVAVESEHSALAV